MRVEATRIVRNRDGEWVVKAYGEGGRRIPSADYFTTDADDAIVTAALMTETGRGEVSDQTGG
jgi:hypothetical protein